MSQETKQDTILKQFEALNLRLQSPTLPESEKQATLIQAQMLLNRYNQLTDVQSEKLKKLYSHMNSIVNKMK